MIFTSILFIIYVYYLYIKIEIINWPWSDFFQTLIVVTLYLITHLVVLVERGHHSKIITG